MTGQELYTLGKDSPAGNACIPLNFSHTPPRIFWADAWLAEFWYYAVDYNEVALFEPQYYLLLELPSGHPVRMQRLSTRCRCLGPAPEVISKEYYLRMNQYLEECANLLAEEMPTEDQMQALFQQWMAIQPQALGQWLSLQDFGNPVEPQRKQADTQPAAEDLISYWKQEMAKAVKAGDTQKIDEAQQQLLKAMQRRKN